jgi:hypothetical protein
MKKIFYAGFLALASSLCLSHHVNAQEPAVGSSFLKASTASTVTPTVPTVVAPLTRAGCDGVGCDGGAGGCASRSGFGCDGSGNCGGCDGGCDGRGGRLGGLRSGFLSSGLSALPIMRSEGCYDCFISPITNPVYFEDPRLMTEARGIFLQHRVPSTAGGGSVQLYAIQLRARLTENVAFIATKDGFATSSNPLVDDGWADTAFGLKFALFRNPAAQTLLSAGFTYELATGEASALQGNGNGNLNLFYSGGRKLFNSINWVSGGGFRVPMDWNDESTVFYTSQHLSKNIGPRTWVLTELNVQNWTRGGQGGIPGVEGGDLFNFGSTGVAGNTIVTNAVGLKFKPRRNQEIGAAFEYPLTERRDIIDNRIHVNYIVRY